MRQFTLGELSRLQATQEGAMQDVCRLLRRGEVNDAYGLPVISWEPVVTVACGFDPNPSTEGMNETQAALMDARLRLPLTIESAMAVTDRIELIRRFGVALNPVQVFDVIGVPQRGPSGLVVDLKKVTE